MPRGAPPARGDPRVRRGTRDSRRTSLPTIDRAPVVVVQPPDRREVRGRETGTAAGARHKSYVREEQGEGAVRSRQTPIFVQPMAARVVDELPEGADWMYEVKFDGYRALLLKHGARVQIRSRNDKDLTATYSSVTAAATRLQAAQAVLDGEIVAVDAQDRKTTRLNSSHLVI